MAEVSIIVPVYQVENYIRQCVDSILEQTFTDFELILVDDGSKDRSGQICDEYARIDERVKVIHQDNCGASVARNIGIDEAIGRYFMFIDSDDYIAPDMVECLYKNIVNNSAEIAVCNYYCFEDDGRKNYSTNFISEILSGTEIFYKRKNERNYGFWTVVWNKLFTGKLFEKIRFRKGKYYEDEFLANEIYQMDIKIVTVSECLYYYRQHETNTMKIKNIKRSFDIVEAFQERIEVYLKNEQYSHQAYKVFIFSLEYLSESKRLITNKEEKKCFIQAENRTKGILKQLKKRKLTIIQKISLVFIDINPCVLFSVGIKFRVLLERFL